VWVEYDHATGSASDRRLKELIEIELDEASSRA
jgi:hypothetical protein